MCKLLPEWLLVKPETILDYVSFSRQPHPAPSTALQRGPPCMITSRTTFKCGINYFIPTIINNLLAKEKFKTHDSHD